MSETERSHRIRFCAMLLVALISAFAVFAAIPAVGAATAQSTWSGPVRVGRSPVGGHAVKAVSCPAASKGTAVDGAGAMVTFDPQGKGAIGGKAASTPTGWVRS